MGHSFKVRIGLREITAMQPHTVLWDVEVKGFSARRQFSDVVTYSVIFRNREGRQNWFKLGRHPILTPHIARTEAIRILRAVTLGEDPANDRYALRSGATVAELLNDYLGDMDAHKLNGKKASTKKADKSRIENHIRPRLGKLRVAAITQSQIEHFMNGCPPGSARTIMALLSSIFTFAIKRKLRADNPCKGIVLPKDNRKTRRLSVSEYAQLGTALGSASVPNDVFLFLAVSGWRSSEARLLKHSEIDLERRIATLGDTKTGVSIRPLSSAAIDIIKRQSSTSEYVFALQKGHPASNLFPPWRKLGLAKDVTQHTLRHSFASLSADMGYSDNVIAGMLGHARSSITSRYVHLERALIEAADKVAQATLDLMCASRKLA
jgi:integrase